MALTHGNVAVSDHSQSRVSTYGDSIAFVFDHVPERDCPMECHMCQVPIASSTLLANLPRGITDQGHDFATFGSGHLWCGQYGSVTRRMRSRHESTLGIHGLQPCPVDGGIFCHSALVHGCELLLFADCEESRHGVRQLENV